MLKRFALLLTLALLVPILAACGGATPASNEPAAPAASAEPAAQATEAPAAGGEAGAATTDGVDRAQLASELYLYNWSDYIDETLLADFEAEYGVKVVLDTYDSNEDMLAKIRAGNSGYDIIVPSDYAVDIAIKEGLVQELDFANIPNFKHIKPEYTKTYFDPEQKYSVPYFVGTTGIAYNQKFFPTPPDSWAALFDPAQLEPSAGKVSMLDDERESIGAALIYLGKTLNDTDPAALQEAQELLLAQKPLLAAYNSSDYNRKLAGEEVVIAHAWNGGAAQAYSGIDDLPGNPDIRYVIPKEGGTIWQDNFMVVNDSPNKYTAEVFINFMLRPEIGARNTDYVFYVTPNAEAEKLLSEETKAVFALGFAPTPEEVQRLQWIKRSDANNTVFSDIWTSVKSS
jgi:spermidine/putrescine transport system substrate-binding protein